VKDAVAAVAIHGFKCVGGGGRGWSAAAYRKAVDVGESNGRNFAGECERNSGTESEGAEGGVLLAMAQATAGVFGLQGAVEPAVLSAFDAGRAGLHVVLASK